MSEPDKHNMNPKIFADRRKDLIDMIGDGIAILATAYHQSRNSDVLFPFRPDSDFYYLTHFSEPEAIAVFAPGRTDGEFLLFCRERDADKEQWDGLRAGLRGAVEHYGADQAFPIDQFNNQLPELLDSRKKIYGMIGRYPDLDHKLLTATNTVRGQRRSGVHPPGGYIDLRNILHEMRLIKNREEIKLMRAAAKLAAAGHVRAMRYTAPDKKEFQVQAELECEFRLGGSEYPAYPSIVAGGENACILHYIDNNCELRDGDLLLIDAGAELDCYASDITRTFPVNGKFSGEQKVLYEIVLASQKAALEQVRSQCSVDDYHQAAVRVLTEGMVDIGLLKGETNELIETGAYYRFYMHRTGHWLGMDVHDVGDYKIDGQWRLLEPGMVLTVEPGIYIDPGEDVDSRWHNIGIRIEDDVHVTNHECEILTRDAPKEPDEIEAVMADQ